MGCAMWFHAGSHICPFFDKALHAAMRILILQMNFGLPSEGANSLVYGIQEGIAAACTVLVKHTARTTFTSHACILYTCHANLQSDKMAFCL